MPPLVGYLIAGIIIGALEIAEHGAWMAALRVG
jgi:Kef-type K+ transport system membrane component KefB